MILTYRSFRECLRLQFKLEYQSLEATARQIFISLLRVDSSGTISMELPSLTLNEQLP